MDRIIDEIILAALCLLALSLAPFEGAHVVALLCAVLVACCFYAYPKARARFALAGAYLLVAVAVPAFVVFLPPVVYVLFAQRPWPVRLAWLLPFAAFAREGQHLVMAAVGILCAAACFMAWRAVRAAAERERALRLRDEQQEAALSLAQRNRDLLEAQDYEVRLATLSERSRIAREIHDNVGHLLTRSIMQVEALQVVHADDARVKAELSAVGATLHEAMDTVRTSVHNLHDDAFDLRARLEGVIGACGLAADVRLSYDARDVPVPVAYGLVAVVREALSNVARHSDATRVDVSLVEYPALYQLIVRDNGTRAASAAAAERAGSATGGIGLQTMEERVSAWGGRVRAEYDKGFRVFVTIPKEDA